MSKSLSAEPGRKRPYSSDVRWRIVWQRLSLGLSYNEIARRLNIAASTVFRTFRLFMETDDIVSKQNSRMSMQKLSDREQLIAVGFILSKPQMYLAEICAAVEDMTGTKVSPATMCRILKKHGITRKKVAYIAKQRSQNLRAKFLARVFDFHKEQFVFIDESGCDRRDCMRKMGYAVIGETPRDVTLLSRGKRMNVIAAISYEGILAVDIFTGTANSERFVDFVRGTLIPSSSNSMAQIQIQ